MLSKYVNRVPVNRITGYITRDRFQLTVTDTRKSDCDLRHLAVGRDTSVHRKQIMIKSVHHSRCSRLISVKLSVVSSHRPTGAEHGRSFRPTSHPLSNTGRCTCRPARLMSATAPAAAVKGSCQRKCPRQRCRRHPLIAATTYNNVPKNK